jgi:hypothetical protein
MLVDKNMRYRNRPVVLELATFFGQVIHIFVVRLGISKRLKLKAPETLILAAIRTCANVKSRDSSGSSFYYTQGGCLEVVDMNCIQCVIGRIKDGHDWAILDRNHGATSLEAIDA